MSISYAVPFAINFNRPMPSFSDDKDVKYVFHTNDIVFQKMAIINSVNDGIRPASNGAISSAISLLKRTKDLPFEVFRTFNGRVQINYYHSERPLEIYVSHRRYDVLFPDDSEYSYKKLNQVIDSVKNYFAE